MPRFLANECKLHDLAHDIKQESIQIKELLGEEAIKGIVYVGCCCGHEAGVMQESFPNAVVHAIEATPETYEKYLKDDRPCCGDKIQTFNYAISNYSGTAKLNVKAPIITQHTILKPLDWDSEESLTVPCKTLQEHCLETNMLPDILVLDTEGVPGRVLIGCGPDILWNLKAVLVETELEDANVFEDGDTDSFVNRILEVFGMKRIIVHVPSSPVRQINSLWARKP